MWIRTQDRETLYNCDYFDVLDNAIYGGRNETNIDLLATYATQDRAIEVLDEIQENIETRKIADALMLRMLDTDLSFVEHKSELKKLACVYEMPKE